jgi:xanthine dehydrogenase YagS FAD-binding subunit
MRPFGYQRATGEAAAIAALAQNPHARAVAGGTNLLDLMKLDVEAPDELIDIGPLSLGRIESTGRGLRIGALAGMADVAAAPPIRDRFPVIGQALLASASPQLRNMASIGGNLLQRTRCAYFRDTAFACNKRQPGSGCDAIAGEHRMHAILGTSEHCVATHASDLAVALVALDAVVALRGPDGEREVPLVDFYLTPGATPERETVLRQGELIVAVEVPDSPVAARSCYLKVRDRAAFEFALVSAAVGLDVADGRIDGARIALGGVGTRPWRAPDAERLLVGRHPGSEVFGEAAAAALHGARPLRQNAFKVKLAQATLVRALTTVAGGAASEVAA